MELRWTNDVLTHDPNSGTVQDTRVMSGSGGLDGTPQFAAYRLPPPGTASMSVPFVTGIATWRQTTKC